MKTRNKNQEIEIARIGADLATLEAQLRQAQEKIELLSLYGIDKETGMMDRKSEEEYDRLRVRESKLMERISELELELKSKRPSRIPSRNQDIEVDEWRIVDDYTKAREEEKLKEIRQLRERLQEKENDRER